MSTDPTHPGSQRQGILAIWNDCVDGREAEVEAWYQQEHLIERLDVPGIIYGRRHEALAASPRYFVFYVTETVDTLFSPSYIERLENPTPLTRRIMSEVFTNTSRTVCRRELALGSFRGSTVVTTRFPDPIDPADMDFPMSETVDSPGVARLEFWRRMEPDDTAIAEEERLRGGDQKTVACLMIETLRRNDAERLAADLTRRFPDARTGLYQVLCDMGNGQR